MGRPVSSAATSCRSCLARDYSRRRHRQPLEVRAGRALLRRRSQLPSGRRRRARRRPDERAARRLRPLRGRRGADRRHLVLPHLRVRPARHQRADHRCRRAMPRSGPARRGALQKVTYLSSSMVFESTDVVAVVRGARARGPAAAVVVRVPEAGGRVLRPGRVGPVRAAVHDRPPVQLRGCRRGPRARRDRGAQRERQAGHEPRGSRPGPEGAEGPGPAAPPRRRHPDPPLHLRRRSGPRASSRPWSIRRRATTTSISRPSQSTTVLELAELIWRKIRGDGRAVPLCHRRRRSSTTSSAGCPRPRRRAMSSGSRRRRPSTRCSTRSSPGSREAVADGRI